MDSLIQEGWSVLVVWECETRAIDTLEARLAYAFGIRE